MLNSPESYTGNAGAGHNSETEGRNLQLEDYMDEVLLPELNNKRAELTEAREALVQYEEEVGDFEGRAVAAGKQLENDNQKLEAYVSMTLLPGLEDARAAVIKAKERVANLEAEVSDLEARAIAGAKQL